MPARASSTNLKFISENVCSNLDITYFLLYHLNSNLILRRNIWTMGVWGGGVVGGGEVVGGGGVVGGGEVVGGEGVVGGGGVVGG